MQRFTTYKLNCIDDCIVLMQSCHKHAQVIDTFLGVGPMRDMTVGDAMSSAAAEWGQDSRRGPPQLVACSGQGKQGALSVLRRNLVPELILEVPIPGTFQISAMTVHHQELLLWQRHSILSMPGNTQKL